MDLAVKMETKLSSNEAEKLLAFLVKGEIALQDAMFLWQGPKWGGRDDYFFVAPHGLQYSDDGWMVLEKTLACKLKSGGACLMDWRESNNDMRFAETERIIESAREQGVSQDAINRALSRIPEWRDHCDAG